MEALPESPFHAFQLDCGQFIQALEGELASEAASHEVKAGHETAIVVSVSTKGRLLQDERVDELIELVQSDGMTVLDTVRQRPKEIHPKYLLGIGKLKEAVMKALRQGHTLDFRSRFDARPGASHCGNHRHESSRPRAGHSGHLCASAQSP